MSSFTIVVLLNMPLCPFSCLLIFRRMQAWAETVNPQAAEPSRCKHRAVRIMASALCLYCICIRCHRTKTNQALPSLLSWDSAGWGSSLGGRIARRHADWWFVMHSSNSNGCQTIRQWGFNLAIASHWRKPCWQLNIWKLGQVKREAIRPKSNS
jgi:hypothetical protein